MALYICGGFLSPPCLKPPKGHAAVGGTYSDYTRTPCTIGGTYGLPLPTCILYHKKNSILKFPIKYRDKSYCEDIIHSIIRRKKNLKHFVVRNSKIMTDKISYNDFNIKQIFDEFVIRKILLNYTKGNIFRFYIWCIFEIVNRVYKKLIFNNNKVI